MTRFIKTRKGIKSPKMSAKKKDNSQKSNSQKCNLQKSKPKRNSGSDITMCKGGECPFKDMCHRYTALPDESHQSYFTKPPFKIDKGKPSCEMFWGDAAQQLFLMLKELMGGQNEKRKANTKTTPEKRKGIAKIK